MRTNKKNSILIRVYTRLPSRQYGEPPEKIHKIKIWKILFFVKEHFTIKGMEKKWFENLICAKHDIFELGSNLNWKRRLQTKLQSNSYHSVGMKVNCKKNSFQLCWILFLLIGNKNTQYTFPKIVRAYTTALTQPPSKQKQTQTLHLTSKWRNRPLKIKTSKRWKC